MWLSHGKPGSLIKMPETSATEGKSFVLKRDMKLHLQQGYRRTIYRKGVNG